MVGAVFLIMAFQSVVTLSLHCAELIVNMSRDERVYRALIGPRGTNGHYNSVMAACTSWQTIFLFALKAGVHWMFGLAINLQFQLGVTMYPPQIFYFSGLCLAAAIFGLILSVWHPSGYLPAAYGHIQTIVDVVDKWADSGCMFWGEIYPGFTGTRPDRLKPPDERREYGGRNDRRYSSARFSGVPTELHSFAPSPATPQPQFPGWPTPPLYDPAPSPFPPQQPFAQWSQQHPQQAQNRTSHNSLNSQYSGWSNYSSQSTQPFLSGFR
jgi:hypothetical protein